MMMMFSQILIRFSKFFRKLLLTAHFFSSAPSIMCWLKMCLAVKTPPTPQKNKPSSPLKPITFLLLFLSLLLFFSRFLHFCLLLLRQLFLLRMMYFLWLMFRFLRLMFRFL